MRVIDQYTVKEIMSDEKLKELAYKETIGRQEILEKVDELLDNSYQYINVYEVANLYEVSANKVVELLDIDGEVSEEDINLLVSRRDVLHMGFLLSDVESEVARVMKTQLVSIKDAV